MAVLNSLPDFLRAAARKPFVYGAHDCLMFPAGWVMAAGRGDPAERFRGGYATAEEAQALLKESGGVVRLMGSALFAVGVRRAKHPCRGDVAAVDSEVGPIGAIVLSEAVPARHGEGMMALTACLIAPQHGGGVSIARRPVLKVWRVVR